jgi:ribose-phosphate pyrophosphokinase
MDELTVFTGNAHPALAQKVVDYLGIPLGKAEVFQFANENIFVRILENVRSRDTFVVQPLASPVNQNLVELLIMLDALKRASAERITAVIPYYAYGRSDRKDQPRVPITARLLADLLTVAGASRVLTVDLHSAQIQGFFNIPVDELTGLYLLVDYFKKKKFDSDLVVVAADIGISKRARDVAVRLNAPLAIMEKHRSGNDDRSQILMVIGDVAGKIALVVDDEISTGGTLANNVNTLIERGAKEVYFCATHPIFSGPALERIATSRVKEVVVTDSLPVANGKKLDKITVLPFNGTK